jgi:hypothetical protein
MEENLTTNTGGGQAAGRSNGGKPLLGRLIKWTSVAALLFTIGVIAVYCAGSYREYGDAAQFKIIRVFMSSAILLVLASLYGIILNVWYFFRTKNRRFLLGLPGYALLVIAGGAIAAGAGFIISFAGGNS